MADTSEVMRSRTIRYTLRTLFWLGVLFAGRAALADSDAVRAACLSVALVLLVASNVLAFAKMKVLDC